MILGLVLSDMETMPNRPLDKIRNLSCGWKIQINLTLITIIALFGSIPNDKPTNPTGCDGTIEFSYAKATGFLTATYDERCTVYDIVSMNGFLSLKFIIIIAALATMLLALTSEVAQWILDSQPLQFLGKISYSLYLIHELVSVWMMRDTYNYFLSQGVLAENAIGYVFAIYTPVLILISWLLYMLVDKPSKIVAGEIDRQIRKDRPDPIPIENPESGELEKPDKEKFYSCSEFIKRNFVILFGFLIWLILVFIVGEILSHFHGLKPIIAQFPQEFKL